jgi:hypothetical protein
MKVLSLLSKAWNWVTDPKNRSKVMVIAMVILLLLFLQQCNATRRANEKAEAEKNERVRVENNFEASQDTLEQYMIDNNTLEAEKLGLTLTIDEWKDKYQNLWGDYQYEKNKPPKVIVETVYIIKDSIIEVPVFIDIDSTGDGLMYFSDSAYFDTTSINYRILGGKIPFKLYIEDSIPKIIPGNGNFDLTIGMGLNLGLFRDKDTKKIYIKAQTDYPGVTFTQLNGAYIMDDPESRKVTRHFRRTWALGLNLGYGLTYNNGVFYPGPTISVGLNYQPKFLQFGK